MASRVKEHFSDETNRYNKLPVRLIGNQAIALARYYYRLVDTLESEDETEAQTIQRLALSKIGEYLRNAGGLFNRIETNSAQVAELKEMCSMYFNLMSLFFSFSLLPPRTSTNALFLYLTLPITFSTTLLPIKCL